MTTHDALTPEEMEGQDETSPTRLLEPEQTVVGLAGGEATRDCQAEAALSHISRLDAR